MKYVMGVETSCDDTSTALVREDGFTLSQVLARQNSLHKLYGGVVPELAGRRHDLHLLPLMEKCLKESRLTWKDVKAFAVTSRPGLLSSLVVGLTTVKTLALVQKKPFTAVNHIEGHILSPFLWDKKNKKPEAIKFPFLALIVSGGHTHLFHVKDFGSYTLLGKTLDDSAGEVLDKFARSAGLGWPGGQAIDKLSQKGSKGKYVFKKVFLKKGGLNFSFSGLKTAGLVYLKQNSKKKLADLAADFQEAVVEQLIDRLEEAVQKFSFKQVVIAGGVSANSRLRQRADLWARKKDIALIMPPLQYCTDNGAMIAFAGFKALQRGVVSSQDTACHPHFLPQDFE